MAALHDVVRAGKARYLGASAMAAWQFAKAQAVAERHGWTRFVSMQHRYNLLDRYAELEMLPLCRDDRVGVLAYSPLARGMLAGSRSSDGTRKTARAQADAIQDELYGDSSHIRSIECLAEIARDRGVAPARVALAWLLHQPALTAPIIGATSASHLDDAAAATSIELTPDEIEALDGLDRAHAQRHQI